MRALLPLALLFLAAPAAAQPDSSHAQSVEVQLSSFSFAPDHIRLPHGEAIVLHLVNSGHGGHNFSAPEFFAAASAPPPAAETSTARSRCTAIRASTSTWSRPRGQYHLRCTHTMHTAFGMTGEISVE